MKVRADKKTFKRTMIGTLTGMIIITLMLVGVSLYSIYVVNQNYQATIDRLLNLNTFYEQLEETNNSVYNYTLSGDENIYSDIQEQVTGTRSVLQNMTLTAGSRVYYRNIRDLEEMYLSYYECVQKIYEHSYLCDVITIGSRNTGNKYYESSQKVYDAIYSQFRTLYSTMLDDAALQSRNVQRQNLFFYREMIAMVIVTVIFEYFYQRALVRKVIQPIQNLTDSIRGFDGQNTDRSKVKIGSNTEREMSSLLHAYNSMILRIQNQMDEIRKNAHIREKLKDQEMENLRISNRLKSSELKALQMQINPHFLFNTLNMISQTAYLENADQTVELLGSTAKLLRYTLDYTGKEVTLAREIELLGSYVSIQEQRFGDRIRFEFDLDESHHQMHVPSMILQPLVENSLKYGVGMKTEGALIRICTRYRADKQQEIIIVSDNGTGMERKRLEEVRRSMTEKNGNERNIGLSNVCLRLSMFFNGDSRMSIHSRTGRGTTVVLRLPCPETEKGEQKNVSDNNS